MTECKRSGHNKTTDCHITSNRINLYVTCRARQSRTILCHSSAHVGRHQATNHARNKKNIPAEAIVPHQWRDLIVSLAVGSESAGDRHA